MLDRRNKSFKDIAATLRVYHENVGEEPQAKEGEPPGALSQREILVNLIAFVDGC
jgi:beta-catenin-like protein 1